VTSKIEGTLKASDDLTSGGKEGNLSRVRHHNCQDTSFTGNGLMDGRAGAWDYHSATTQGPRKTDAHVHHRVQWHLGFSNLKFQNAPRLPFCSWRFEEHRLLRHHSHRHIEL